MIAMIFIIRVTSYLIITFVLLVNESSTINFNDSCLYVFP